ncbi:hypothetical protein LguiB_018368 [Lonicera macranthoides]
MANLTATKISCWKGSNWMGWWVIWVSLARGEISTLIRLRADSNNFQRDIPASLERCQNINSAFLLKHVQLTQFISV